MIERGSFVCSLERTNHAFTNHVRRELVLKLTNLRWLFRSFGPTDRLRWSIRAGEQKLVLFRRIREGVGLCLGPNFWRERRIS